MTELLNELKNGEANEDSETHQNAETGTPYGQGSSHKLADQNNAAMELLDSVTGADEGGRSRQRILTFAAKRTIKIQEDYDALYNWALVLQESADNVCPDSVSPSKDALLEEACKKYEAATHLCPTLNDAYYYWAIAISDRAKMCGRTKEAEELWKQATKNYEKAVQLNLNSPQDSQDTDVPMCYAEFVGFQFIRIYNLRLISALNNWGLALQIVKVQQRHQSPSLSSISGGIMSTSIKPAIRVDVQDITSVSECADLALPPGVGLCINTINGPVFMSKTSPDFYH